MKLHIVAVGAMKSGPERALVDDYRGRAEKLARSLGVRAITEIDVAGGGGKAAEADRLLARCPAGATLICLDEGGTSLSSEDLASLLSRWRDGGEANVCFLIGGADGHGRAVKAAAAHSLAFGEQTWPHKLVRVMVAEQLYRALTILAGTPYHKA